jgi:peptidyl-prolyl cis-trans isomerase D
MLEFFRRSIKSRVGAVVGIIVLGLIALAFASADVAGTGNFGGVAGGDRVASVGKQRLSTADLSQAASLALENLKQENPRLSMQAFLAADGLNRVLDDMVSRMAVAEFGRQAGIVASDRLIDSEIAKMAAFRGPDGKFSESAFRQVMQQRGVSEAMVRRDLAQGLSARQILLPAGLGAAVPVETARRYAALLGETRHGSVALLPSVAFMPRQPPGDAELAAFYKQESDRFIRPERRVVRYVAFGEEALKSVPAPTEAEISARFEAGKAQYAALESRTLTQLIVPTEAAARAVAAEVAAGTAIENAARAKGLATAKVGPLSREALAGQASKAVSDAVFAAPRGSLAAPARSGLGWHVVRVDSVDLRPARKLEQVRGELIAQLTAAKRRAAFADLSARIEEEFDNGGNLAEAAKELGLTLQATPPITADGDVYGKVGEKSAPQLARVLQTAFAMEKENAPQIAEIEPGKTYLMFDVTDIAASAPAPLAEIRADVQTAWAIRQGAALAKAAAERLQAAIKQGAKLPQAAAALNTPLPPVQAINMNRRQLASAGQQVPPPLMLLFSMAQGTVKALKGENDQGWFVVALDRIETQDIKADNPLVPLAQRQLSQITGNEYVEQLRTAIRAQVGVERNAAAIKAVREQLGGGGN